MNKWQVTAVSVLSFVLVLSVTTATYFLISGKPGEKQVTTVKNTQTVVEKDLAGVKTDLENDNDLDLADLDTTLTELETLDLTGV